MGKIFVPPEPVLPRPVLSHVIADLPSSKPAKEKNYTNGEENLCFSNHEYMTGGFSSHFMSRNRVRQWHEPSFTIQASGRHIPIHPKAPKMVFIEKDKRAFVADKKDLYRRLTIRECARIQSFPDNFLFKYNKLEHGYKMVGNAVPVEFAKHLAVVIHKDISDYLRSNIARKLIKNYKNNAILEPA
jgi:DNA (cytosine-5)-methyltransferase 1